MALPTVLVTPINNAPLALAYSRACRTLLPQTRLQPGLATGYQGLMLADLAVSGSGDLMTVADRVKSACLTPYPSVVYHLAAAVYHITFT